jgi:uncharacterized surface protein with fasciclin (FAS1) repeats
VAGAVLCLGVLSIGATACSDDPSSATPDTTAAPPATDAPAETTAPPNTDPYVPPLGDIVGEALVAANVPDLAGQFSTLAGLLVRADPTISLVHALQDDGSTKLTVFAPLNSAFPKVPAVALEAVYADNAALTQVLTYHVVAGEYTSDMLTDGLTLTTLQGEDLEVTVKGEKILINGNAVIAADVPATNGVIHVMDDVLVPPTIISALELG